MMHPEYLFIESGLIGCFFLLAFTGFGSQYAEDNRLLLRWHLHLHVAPEADVY